MRSRLAPMRARSIAPLLLAASLVSAQNSSTSSTSSTSAASSMTSSSPSSSTSASATPTESAGPSMMSSSTTLQLAALFQGQSFLSGFNFFTADDPTGGYVNYVDQSTAQSSGLVSIASNGAFIMSADSTNLATGRGRNSVRLVSNNYWNDGVYIIDLNHMPVGCGAWPAFWTVVENGWPVGGEIDIIEGANMPPTLGSAAWGATTGAQGGFSALNSTLGNVPSLAHDTVSLHTSDNCLLDNTTYQTGTYGAQTCSAYLNGNIGCGVELAGNSTFGQDTAGRGFNAGGGGWYAMWRDIQSSGGVYVYYWPRNSPNVPDDVRNVNTQSTNVTNWGEPAANLTVGCKGDFGDHVIVFNIAFCGDYSAATYLTSGCPGTCTSFVSQNPAAFSETYWSINSLRIYNANGKPIIPPGSGSKLSMGAIIGIAVGGGVALILVVLGLWRWRVVKRRRAAQEASANAALAAMAHESDSEDRLKSFSALASGNPFGAYTLNADGSVTPSPRGSGSDTPPDSSTTRLALLKNRTGKTTLSGHKTALHALDGETGHGYYHQQLDDEEMAQVGTGVALNAFTTVTVNDRRKSSAKSSKPRGADSRKASAASEPAGARSRQPSLAPPSISMASQRSRMKSVPNVGSSGYVTGSAMAHNNAHVTAGGSFVNAAGAGGRRPSAFQQAAGAQKSWVG